MSKARIIGYAVMGLLLGAAFGAGIGLLGGLAYTNLVATSGFEGYSGFVVAYWILAGIFLGLIAGCIIGVTRGRRG